MWPFKKREATKVSVILEAINDLKSFRDIGEKFNYMEIEMIVESHFQPDFCNGGGYPIISAAYKNNKGELKHASFTRKELKALRAENPSKKSTAGTDMEKRSF